MGKKSNPWGQSLEGYGPVSSKVALSWVSFFFSQRSSPAGHKAWHYYTHLTWGCISSFIKIPEWSLVPQSLFPLKGICEILTCVLVSVSIAAIKHHDQKASWEGKGFFHGLPSIIGGRQDRNSSRTGNWRQKLMQKPWSDLLTGSASHGCLSLHFYRPQNHSSVL